MPGRRRSTASNDEGLRGLGAQTSDTVKQAADILERELSAGLDEARTLQQKLVDGKSLADGDLDDVTARLRRNAHTVIDVVSDRVTEMGAGDVQDLNARFTKDAHQVFDSFMDLVGASPGLLSDVVSRLQRSTASDAGATSPVAADTPRAQAAPEKTAAGKAPAKKAAPRKRAARPSA